MSRRSYITFAGSEAEGISILAGIYDEGGRLAREIDLIAIQNHNLADLTVDGSEDNGSTFTEMASESALTEADTIIALSSPIAADKVRLTASETQDSGEAKQIGTLILGSELLQPRVGLASFDPIANSGVIEDRMGDGTPRRAYVYNADASYILTDYEIGFRGLTDDEVDEFEDKLLHAGEPFLFIPFPAERPNIIARVEVVASSWSRRYLSLNRGAGLALDFTLRDMGGA